MEWIWVSGYRFVEVSRLASSGDIFRRESDVLKESLAEIENERTRRVSRFQYPICFLRVSDYHIIPLDQEMPVSPFAQGRSRKLVNV